MNKGTKWQDRPIKARREKRAKRLGIATLAIIVALSLALPSMSFAQSLTQDETTIDAADVASSVTDTTATAPSEADVAAATDPVTDCTITIEYYENPIYLEPGATPDETGRILMGTKTVGGYTEGQVVSAWDFVADIPGYFFFDGWPGSITVSKDPSKNVFTLIYFRYSHYSYTVNYYLMTGADLTANTWSDALAPDTVEFIKLGSETFDDQPYDKLVEGDAYAYRIDGTYVVDTYPSSIRVGEEPDDNTINVLYVPDATTLPDELEVPNDTNATPDNGSNGGTGGSTGGSSGPNGDSSNSGSGSNGSLVKPPVMEPTHPTLPDDEEFTKDEIIEVLPGGNGIASDSAVQGGMTKQEVQELFNDFIGMQRNEDGTIEITDEMLENPLSEAEAISIRDAFLAGVHYDAHVHAQPWFITHAICIAIIVILAILAIVGFSLYAHARSKASGETANSENGQDV